MELLDVSQEASPLGAERVRLVGRVAYDDAPHSSEAFWFDLPRAEDDSLAERGDAWLACLLPLAVQLVEPLRLRRAVDPRLRENAAKLLEIWRAWDHRRRPIEIEAPLAAVADPADPRPAALLFSGGVDSFFSALEADSALDTLVAIGGFDVPLRKRDELARLRDTLARAADDLGRSFAFVLTNLRETRLRCADWEQLAHGAALAAVGHLFAGRFARLWIASGNGYADLAPCGSHPRTDPLFSSSRLEVVHHGAASTRAEKLARVAKSEIAARHLRVCWRARTAGNCGQCRKCWCTMLQLHQLGALERFATFPGADFDPRAAARVDSRRAEVRAYLEELRLHAQATGQREAARAIARGFRRSDRLAALTRAAPWLERPALARLFGLRPS